MITGRVSGPIYGFRYPYCPGGLFVRVRIGQLGTSFQTTSRTTDMRHGPSAAHPNPAKQIQFTLV